MPVAEGAQRDNEKRGAVVSSPKRGGHVKEIALYTLDIAQNSITADGKFSLDSCRCVGACGLAPVMMINNDVYGRLTPDQVGPILDMYK